MQQKSYLQRGPAYQSNNLHGQYVNYMPILDNWASVSVEAIWISPPICPQIDRGALLTSGV